MKRVRGLRQGFDNGESKKAKAPCDKVIEIFGWFLLWQATP